LAEAEPDDLTEATDETGEEEAPAETPTPEPTSAPPAPVTGTLGGGAFELGGQTHSLANPGYMQQAGMTWVKFQHKWNPGDDPAGTVGGRISQGQSQGFKVLLSIPGVDYPTQPIDYAAYVEYLRGVAALGPDAIEVWNEPNLWREWPPGSISGITYTNEMLKPAYEAIKGVNPNIMVISGGPAPTGFFSGCADRGCDDWMYIAQMAEAGAANYMDCVGVHYNEGIVPPSATGGDPRDDFYSRYFWGMTNLYYSTFGGVPLCYTEFGYLTGEGLGDLPDAFAWAGSTTVQDQANWLAEAALLSSQSGQVRMMIVFNVDIQVWGYDPQAGYAIIRPDGGCPACEALAAIQP
ncbi:MAG: hypothetical protein GYB68_00665, partial [Chloroflexi bacterium]|nr:hypothetical protein [Chloroflexota bacterium]